MSLRRFPWKIPRLTDNSYKLFVATSSPGTTPVDRRTSEQQRPRSIADASSVNDPRRSTGPDSGRQDTDDASVASSKHHHSHHHSHHQENSKDLEVPPKEEPPKQEPQKQEVIKGPWRLLRLLPRESRSIIGRMLEIDPKKRATIEDILADQWVQNSLVCQEENGKFIRAPGHTHTLEPPGPAESPAPSKK